MAMLQRYKKLLVNSIDRLSYLDRSFELTQAILRVNLRVVLMAVMLPVFTSIAIAQVTVRGNVYGGGNLAEVGGTVEVNIKAGTVEKDVYGGGALANTNINNIPAESYTGTGEETGNTFTYTTTVNLLGGTIKGDAYGGGLGKMGTAVAGEKYTQDEANAYNQENNLNEGDEGFKTTEDWKVEPVAAGADGAGAVKAMVYGDVEVTLGSENGSTATKFYIYHYDNEHADVVKSGRVFGCNNLNGSPLGNVTVTVWKTAQGNIQRSESANKSSTDATYELAAVYGGGNLANYTATDKKTHVIVNGCGDPSIEYVYGGGNAAAVPEASVDINATYEVGYVFGGGNGKDQYTLDNGTNWIDNPGANVNGNATTRLYGGVIHEAFGGSNEKGAISGSVSINSNSALSTCDLSLGKLYGAGKNADIDGDLIVIMDCMPGDENPTDEVYGGAENANVKGNVELTITSGSFRKVFGGNNTSGAIFGHIILNIEETGCTPIKIDELYLGGYNAPYSVYGYKNTGTDDAPVYVARTSTEDGTAVTFDFNEHTTPDATTGQYDDPVLNIISCTSIGKVFGGGLGSGAVIYGNPTVNINQIYGIKSDGNGGYTDKATTLGEIGDVYGGGNEAAVVGNTEVNICTQSSVEMNTEPKHLGTPDTDYTYDDTKKKYIVPVVSANITSNVFGAGKGVETDVTKAMVSGKCTVNMANGTVKKSVYGGGELSLVDGDTEITVSGGTIGTPNEGTTVYGGAMYGNIYGGGQGNTTTPDAGLIKGNTKITVQNTVVDENTTITPTILHNIYGGGAYGTVGEFEYDTETGLPTGRKTYTVGGIEETTTGGNTEVYITGGIIGTNGNENGMIFGSSRGDVGAPGSIHDKTAWVYDTHVAIGDTATNATITTATPLIKGSVYGGGENGHNFHSSFVRINGGTIGITEGEPIGTYIADGASYPYRGNVYGGGCGTDMYDSDNDDEKDSYNPLAGIVKGDATIKMTAGTVVHNMYGAGAMGSVGNFEKNATTNAITFNSGGTTTIEISGGTIGVDGTAGEGNVFGAARGDKAVTDRDLALVKETSVTISGTSTQIKGNVYGGGEVGNVHANTTVDVQGGAIAGNVFGGGKGVEDLFTCEQAMVGVEGEGAGAVLNSDTNKNKGTCVSISNGTIGTLSGESLVEGTGNVYGGGEIGRVEWNTQVKIGVGTGEGTFAPVIYGSVFGAGKGLDTHGYSALVRGNSTVTVQGNAKVEHNIYGGGEMSTVGRYWVKGINDNVTGAPTAPSDLPDGMPYQQQSGGVCTVTVQGNAQIGPDAGASDEAGHVFGAGKGVNPSFTAGATKRMVNNADGGSLVVFADDATTGKTAETLYLEFLQTLALVTNTQVTINGGVVKGSVYGGSKSGFVQTNTDVDIQNGTVSGDAFGGGLGLASFAEAGKVKGNTDIAVSGGAVLGNVYGGGRLGDVGIIDKTDKKDDGQLSYNYKWKKNDGTTANDTEINTKTDLNTNTGICKVTISGGTIGTSGTVSTEHGNVFGAGRGSDITWWCEKAIAYATDVSVTGGAVNGNVYGGGQIGRVEDDAKVTIGVANATGAAAPAITGSVFGAGAGLHTHGYSALVRGNSDVTVQGTAQVGGSVFGGGEIASVGKFTVVGGLPKHPDSGGYCTVTIQDNARNKWNWTQCLWCL